MVTSRRFVEPFAAFTARFPEVGIPTLVMTPHRRTAHLSWSDGSLIWYAVFADALDATTMGATLHTMFEAARPTLPRKSELSYGGVHGAWVFCPLDLAQQVRAVVRQHFTAALQQVAAWPDARQGASHV